MVAAPNTALGWGIAGCGWVARDYVAPAIAASRNGLCVALHDRNPAALAAFGQDVPAFTDLGAFLAVPGLAAVYVATPNNAHRALVEAAAARGLHVLCEKPMATCLADAQAMTEACARAGVHYATAFDQRFHPAHQEIARLLAAGAIGRVTAIRIVYACWIGTDWTADNWRADPTRAGGGALFDLAPHGLDLASMLLDEKLVDCSAMGQHRVHPYAVEDGAMLLLRSETDVLVQLHVAYNCPEMLPRRRLEIVGTTGQIVAENTMGQTAGGDVTLIDAASGMAHPVAISDAARSPFLSQVEAFADSVLGISRFPFGPAHDLSVMQLLAGAQSMVAPRERR